MDKNEEIRLESLINTSVRAGHQEDLIELFPKDPLGCRNVPRRIGQWSMRHYRSTKPGTDAESVVALPITVNARHLYTEGCIALLLREGYTEEIAGYYLEASQGVSYAWLPKVVSGVKQMLRLGESALDVINTYKQSENPRKTALTVGIPKHPFGLSHYQFLSVLDISETIFRLKEAADLKQRADALLEAFGNQ